MKGQASLELMIILAGLMLFVLLLLGPLVQMAEMTKFANPGNFSEEVRLDKDLLGLSGNYSRWGR